MHERDASLSLRWIASLVLAIPALVACDETGPASFPDAAVARPDGGGFVASSQDFVAGLADALAPARFRPGVPYLFTSREPEPAEGLRNRDHSNYLRMTPEGRGVLAEDTGPGVITRLWFTIGGRPEPDVGDPVRLHIWIDGRELGLVPGEEGVTLAALTSGQLPGLPRPWVLDRTRASAGFLVNVPMQYAQSMRIEIEPMPELWTYYQVDGRALAEGTPVTSFGESPSDAHDDALARATELWVEHAHPGEDVVDDARELAMGDAIVRELEGPGVITTIDVASMREVRDALEVTIEIDGAIAAETSLGWLTGSAPPGGTYDSSLSAADATSARLYAPIPFETSARIVVRNASDASTTVGMRVRVDAREVPPDVGRFVARCSSVTIDVPTSICEQASPLEYESVVVGGALEGRGQYAGQTFVMRTVPMEAWWWALECDHEIRVDGEPALLGTGTEDYFGGAFYFALGPFSSPTTGASGWRRPEGDADDGSDTHMFRWHLVDGVPFERELRFEYESYVDGTTWDGCVLGYLEP
ncbi:DUF2961 domain-containing protein [Sandaracinus amylolyticus]|uniref:DUF2961 domain-containing protein n=1 Tax=Sandaracinus amylolyticus TaxID=927083 RepID=A0A0F6W2N6_9BACT|nr:DUF2961 domain-containing protein [Sandaracinus amylolyticus]AKF05886.1 hypothetical protein DB32_003035 [Sandaracinus amylolyticus]